VRRYARSVPGFVVGVDYGTATTVGLLRWPDGKVRPLLFDGSPLLPSGVFVEPDGAGLIVGRDALRSARLDPAGYVPDPLRHLDVGEVEVRGRPVPVVELIGAVFVRVGQEAVRVAGGAVPRLMLAHPAGWDDHRRVLLAEASARAGLGVPTLIAAPVAAARQWADRVVGGVPAGRWVLVYDLGAGGCEVSLVRATGGGFEVVAADQLDDAGGLDFDQTFVSIVGVQLMAAAPDPWWQLSVPATTAGQRHRLDFLEAVRTAKEALSREPTVALHVPLVDQEVSVSRDQFERAAQLTVARTAQAAIDVLSSAGVAAEEVADLLLVGGSTRIPMVADMMEHALGMQPIPSEEPELAIAEGLLGMAAPASEPATVQFPAVGPVGPVSPAGPVGPVSPAGPVGPVSPAGPVGPVSPAGPVGPVSPAGPVGPVSPAGPAAEPAGTVGRQRQRRKVVAVAAAGLALVLVVAGLLLGNGPDPAGDAAAPAATSDRPAPLASGDAGLGSVGPGTRSPGTVVGPTPTTTASSSPAASSSPSESSGPPPPVTVSVGVTPAAGGCSTDFVFTARFTVIDPAKYRYHWVLDGPNGYSFTSGDHDQDKTGSVRMSRKFPASGTYSGRIEIVSPVSVTSDPAAVQVFCVRP
jgi:Hsp70 protein